MSGSSELLNTYKLFSKATLAQKQTVAILDGDPSIPIK